MSKSLEQLIEEIKQSNQAQDIAAQIAANTPLVKDPEDPFEPIVRRRIPKNFSGLYTGLSRAFNTVSGKPRYSIKTLVSATRTRDKKEDKEDKDPATYSWSSVTTMEPGITIPMLYGRIKTKGNVFAGHLGGHNNFYEQQIVSFLTAVSKGPIEGFETVTLNDQLLYGVAEGNLIEHTPASGGVAGIDLRYGWNTQPVVSNYFDIYKNLDMSNQLIEYGSEVIVSVDMTPYDDAWIYLNFPTGLYSQPEGSGDLANETCKVKIEVKTSAGSVWTTVYNNDIVCNRRIATRLYLRVPIETLGSYYTNYTDESYDFRITKQTVNKNLEDNKAVNELRLEYITVGIRDDFAYNGIAYVAIVDSATEKLNGSIDLSLVVKGRKVRVYTTTSAYTLIWSDNPAWVCFDVMTQPIWTNASYSWDGDKFVPSTFSLAREDGIPSTDIDIQSFINWAVHCDALDTAIVPPDYDATDTKRCTFNGVFDSATNIWDAAQSIAENARAWLLPPSGTSKYKVVLDKTTSVTQIFNTGNIIQDSLEETYTSMADRATALQVDFLNKENDWESETFNAVYASDEGIREESLSLFGITVPSQAWRRAMLSLYYNAVVTVEVTFMVGQDAMNCEVGDVISVQHELPQWGFGGRIVSGTADTVVLDREVELADSLDYKLSVRSSGDVLTTFDILYASNPATGGYPNFTNTLYGTFSPVPALYDPFAFGMVDMQSKPFRVLEITDNGDTTYQITAQEYNASVYNMDLDLPPIPTPNYSSLVSLPPVTNIVLDELVITLQDGTINDCIDVHFTRPTSSLYARADIYYKTKKEAEEAYGPAWQYAGRTPTEFFRIENSLVDYWHKVAVATINTSGRKKPPDLSPYAEICTVGKNAPPSNVTNFAAIQAGPVVIFTWTHVTDQDLWGYEIRVGNAFVGSSEVIDIQSANRYDYPAPLSGTYTYWIRAVDTTGNESLTPTSVTINVVSTEDMYKLIYDEDLIRSYDNTGQIVWDWSWVAAGFFFQWSPASGCAGTPPSYWADHAADPCLIATFESKNLDLGANAGAPVAVTLVMSQETSIWDEDADDQTYPGRLDTAYPNDTDQHVTSDVEDTDYVSRIYYAYGNSPDPTNWALYDSTVLQTMRYLKVRSVVVANAFDAEIPESITSLIVKAYMKSINYDIPNFHIAHVEGETILYSDYGITMTIDKPTITATMTFGTNKSVLLNAAVVISEVTATSFRIELKDIVGDGRVGYVNIHIIGA